MTQAQMTSSAATGIPELDSAPGESGGWIEDLVNRLGWHDQHKAYLALIATLHALRDNLPSDEAAYLGEQLPTLLRGFYFEGWHLREKPLELSDRETFFSRIHEVLHHDVAIDPEQVVRSVFRLLSKRLSPAELEDVVAASPEPLHGLWPL